MIIAHHSNVLLHCIVACTALIRGPVATVAAKGPHHPGGEFSRKAGKHHLDEHLQQERVHLEDDLKRLPIGEQSLTNMSEDEKNFYYFKLHDSDNNDNLDGLEMLHAATHHHSNAAGQLHGMDRTAKHSPDDASSFLEDEEFNHIIEVIDDFIEFADADKNGLLNYPEYINAINLNEPKAHSESGTSTDEAQTNHPASSAAPITDSASSNINSSTN
ncbi:multiple coagulation factor deficiency protein 2 homolog [Anopheles nili]|uniref:multiple coagulation factor deficiency protein 2 homolog n=1 Tax=Anopheles nili TaxID=185578 RepID=UPI00237B99C7|nr:multiple coagulation factor deficiency protein 2 homolog [Anopheles nili]